jgi:FemAB-related protein (PEP-CTERM system-associated)
MQAKRDLAVRVHRGSDVARTVPRVAGFALGQRPAWFSRHPAWLTVLQYGFGHVSYLLEATESGRTVGLLPLALVRSFLFGRYLVGLPYLNSGGVISADDEVTRCLVDRAVGLADTLHVRHLELRHERYVDHPRLTAKQTQKVHMRLPLPAVQDALWHSFPAKVRNQVRKAQKQDLAVAWGRRELLPDFYAVFSANMRDLGTPVYSPRLFAEALRLFPDRAEICAVRTSGCAVAAALVLHGNGVTEVLSASSLRAFNPTCANMLMYWRLMERAIERGQALFDFGRSTPGGGTYRFKQQWGARPTPSVWQYYVRRGTYDELRPDAPRYRRLVRVWQRLPLPLSQLLGPPIVRGIP